MIMETNASAFVISIFQKSFFLNLFYVVCQDFLLVH